MNELSLQYPPPPPFYALYTDENLERHKKDKEMNATSDLPLDPPPPVTGEYSLFGETLSIVDRVVSLKELGIQQLFDENNLGTLFFISHIANGTHSYPEVTYNVDRVKELKNLNHSLLLNFTALTDILVSNPSQPSITTVKKEIKEEPREDGVMDVDQVPAEVSERQKKRAMWEQRRQAMKIVVDEIVNKQQP
ncbi:Mediator of RNA polymerase II transcription subunit 7 [Chytridiales sp. JEL 0842]|nr:Mediator of RNA polymerase II transcription subunit 7 [Chytridiales sp. JEL 0842]